jgi:hypothetical protein
MRMRLVPWMAFAGVVIVGTCLMLAHCRERARTTARVLAERQRLEDEFEAALRLPPELRARAVWRVWREASASDLIEPDWNENVYSAALAGTGEYGMRVLLDVIRNPPDMEALDDAELYLTLFRPEAIQELIALLQEGTDLQQDSALDALWHMSLRDLSEEERAGIREAVSPLLADESEYRRNWARIILEDLHSDSEGDP